MPDSAVEKYAVKRPQKAPEGDYAPWGTSTTPRRLDVRLRASEGRIIAYGHIVDILYTRSQLLTICTTTCTVTLEGEGLDELRELLLDEKVKWVQCYDKNRFPALAKGAEPVITAITIRNLFEGTA